MLNHHIKDCYGYHIFFTYPEQFFPEPSEFKIYTREFTKAGNDIKCAQLNTNIESLPYFQCSNTLLYGPSGLTPFIRLLFNHSLYVIFITSTTYIGDVTVNFVTIPYFCEFYTGNQITVRNIFHHIMVMQVTVHVSPGVLTLVPVTISPIGIKKVSTNNLIYDMSCDINSCVSKVLYPSKRLWQRIISIPENPVTLLQALDFLRLNSPPSISVALGWENCDIDLSCVTYCLTKSNSYRISRVVYYSNLNAYNGSIEHSGNCPYGCEVDEDGKQGRNEDDETIRIKLTQLPKSIKFIAFCVSSCHEKQLDSVDAGYMRVTSLSKTFEFLFFPLSKAKHTASVIALAERKENDIWDIIPLYYNMNRKQPTELADSFLEVLNNEEAFKNIMSEALKNKGDPKYLI
ncbi:stress protein [Histomonas meleagridis]|uniref:stress protein n=1 Tax=Histomonas meleagridis TaxID=135588 RepID=UPI003559749B|nr:stress protein [Histomonas meleagridis]KAH0800765.1 stress protein [Histomonas meleagridis]